MLHNHASLPRADAHASAADSASHLLAPARTVRASASDLTPEVAGALRAGALVGGAGGRAWLCGSPPVVDLGADSLVVDGLDGAEL